MTSPCFQEFSLIFKDENPTITVVGRVWFSLVPTQAKSSVVTCTILRPVAAQAFGPTTHAVIAAPDRGIVHFRGDSPAAYMCMRSTNVSELFKERIIMRTAEGRGEFSSMVVFNGHTLRPGSFCEDILRHIPRRPSFGDRREPFSSRLHCLMSSSPLVSCPHGASHQWNGDSCVGSRDLEDIQEYI